MLSAPRTIDFHTHEAAGIECVHPERIFRIVSTSQTEIARPDGENLLRSLELHPWHGEPFTETFEALARSGRFAAVGEVGLDRNRGKLPLDEQLETFRKCAKLADRLRKPLIIHCVGCYSELLEEYKFHPWQVPTVLHYFCGKPELFRQLLTGRPGWYISLPPLAVKSAKLMEFLRDTPAMRERILLETDDPSGDIGRHYEIMSEVLAWNIMELKSAMERRFKEIFEP